MKQVLARRSDAVIQVVSSALGRQFVRAERLSGGLINYVWRLFDRDQKTVVAKFFEDHIASAPGVSITDDRWRFESAGARLGALFVGAEYVPRVLHVVAAHRLVVLQDMGRLPSLIEVLVGTPDPVKCGRIGDLIARLHRDSSGDSRAVKHVNAQVQKTRALVQYGAIADWVELDAATIQGVVEYGEALRAPGRCLVMGDLWPASVLFEDESPTFIDWEFSHYGQPEQDVAHLAAHLWMFEHTQGVSGLRDAFVTAYEATGIADERYRRGFEIHYACEILARAVGPFVGGYLYDGALECCVREACEHATESLLG